MYFEVYITSKYMIAHVARVGQPLAMGPDIQSIIPLPMNICTYYK